MNRSCRSLLIFVTVLCLVRIALPATLWHDIAGQDKISQDKILLIPRQDVVVDDFKSQGFILDIGGGGEGVIGQLKGAQVIAIDINKRELVEAPPGPALKIVMDARDLKFLDGTFNTVTVFFTFMYIHSGDHEKVFQEAYRVLAPGGRILIWDVIFPTKTDVKKEMVLFQLKAQLPGKSIQTGYGVRWPAQEQGLPHYLELAKKTGFKAISQSDKGAWFFLELQK